MSQPYLSLDQLIGVIDQPNRDRCQQLLGKNQDRVAGAPGSSQNHQAWRGGYADHVTEVGNIGLVLYDRLSDLRPLSFSRSDVVLVLFLHDIEKPWRYSYDGDAPVVNAELDSKTAKAAFRESLYERYGFTLSSEQQRALEALEVEQDYTNERRGMNELGALCHMADVWSARGWHDYPLVTDDPWKGAQRSAS